MMRYFYIVMLVCCAFTIKAQNEILYKLQATSLQSSEVNPALLPEYSFGIELLNANVNFRGLPYSYADFLNNLFVLSTKKGLGVLNLRGLLGNKSLDDLIIKSDIDLKFLNVVYKKGDSLMFSFSAGIHHRLKVKIPKDLIGFAVKGNYDYLDKDVSIDGLSAHEYSYVHLSMGFATKFDDKLNIGVKFKILQAFNLTEIKNVKAKISTDKDTYNLSLKLNEKATLVTSGYTSYNSKKQYDFNMENYIKGFTGKVENMGLAFDLGATYEFDENISFYFSTTDLGFIYFNYKVYNYDFNENEFIYKHKSLDEMKKLNFSSMLEDLKSKFQSQFTEKEGVVKWLSTNIYLGGDYDFGKFGRVGAMFSMYDVVNGFLDLDFKFTLTYDYHLSDWVNVVLAPAYHNKWFFLGAGFNVDMYAMQLSIVMDNILLPIIPQYSKSAQIMFGLGWIFDKPKEIKKKSEPYNYKELEY